MSGRAKYGVLLSIVAAVAAGSVFVARTLYLRSQLLRTSSDLLGILVSLSNHNDSYDSLPPVNVMDKDGNVLHSWRFRAAVFGLSDPVQHGFYRQKPGWDKAWNSPENQRYLHGPHRDYAGSPQAFIDPLLPEDRTRFVAITGPDTAFDTDQPRNLKKLPPDTILVVQARNCTVHWMEPGGELDVRTTPRAIGVDGGIGSSDDKADGFFVGFADMTVWLIRNDVPFNELAKFFTATGAGEHDRDQVLGPYRIEL